MKIRTIADREVAAIGLGAMAVDEYDPKPSDEDAIKLLQHAVKAGVLLIDTADVYGLGRNETLIGKALTTEEKEKVLIATKAGCTRPGGIGWDTDGRPEHIKEAAQVSMKRLGVKQIELYQLHAPDDRIPLLDSITAMKELQEQGFVKHIGICNVTLDELKEAQQITEIVSVQNHFNLSHKHDEEDLLPYLTRKKIAFLPYFPLRSGRLLKDSKLIKIAEKLNLAPSQVALAWILTKWPTAIPIPGTRSQQHLEENMKAADITLPKDVIAELDSLY